MGEKKMGVDLGGTRIKIGIVEDGSVIETAVMETPLEGGYRAVLDRIGEGARPLLQRYPEISQAGMGVPGLIDTREGIVCCSNNFGWERAPFVKDMEKILPLRIKIANDAQCAALGEALYGAGKGYDRVAMLTLGTGVGGGFIRNGQIEEDGYGSMAYIFGHAVVEAGGRFCNCGRRGCLEAYASAGALERQAKIQYGEKQSAENVFAAAALGEEIGNSLVEEFLGYLGEGAVNIANILRPQVIILGGGVSASAHMILPGIEKALERGVYGYEYAPVKVLCAKLLNEAGIVGAASL